MGYKIKNILVLLVFTLITVFSLSSIAYAEDQVNVSNFDFSKYESFELKDDEIVLRLFHSETCPHCKDELKYLETIKDKYPNVRFAEYEITKNDSNMVFFMLLSESYGKPIGGVPTTFICDDVIVGFSKTQTPKLIEEAIENCINNNKKDTIINIPFIGEIDTNNISMPIFTFVIGLIDGFNPCAIWVLTVLLTLIGYAKSKKRIFLIGGIFALVSGVMYFLIMFVWLTFFLKVNFISDYIRWAMAILAIIVGLINIKELFWFKKGVSLTISEKHKTKLLDKIRKLVKENNMWILIGGTVTLAVFANLIELACTAGLPAIFTSILSMQEPTGSIGYYGYLILYNIAYILPLVVIVTIFALTLGKYKFTENQGKVLKVVSGLLMLALGLILLLKPALLSLSQF